MFFFPKCWERCTGSHGDAFQEIIISKFTTIRTSCLEEDKWRFLAMEYCMFRQMDASKEETYLQKQESLYNLDIDSLNRNFLFTIFQLLDIRFLQRLPLPSILHLLLLGSTIEPENWVDMSTKPILLHDKEYPMSEPENLWYRVECFSVGQPLQPKSSRVAGIDSI